MVKHLWLIVMVLVVAACGGAPPEAQPEQPQPGTAEPQPAATEPGGSVVEPSAGGFTIGQRVYVTASTGINVRNDDGEKIDTRDPNDFGTIVAGPNLLVPDSADIYWKVAWAVGRSGWANESWLSTQPLGSGEQPRNTNRVIYVRVKPHGTTRPVYNEPSRDSGYLPKDGSHDAWLIDAGSAFFAATEYQWAEGEWWFHIDGTPVGGHPVFAGAGWVQYDWGSNEGADRERLDYLEVHAQDDLPLPDFNQPPLSWPP